MNKNDIKKVKVSIVYHYIAHYRKAIFNEMCSNTSNVEYFIVADEKPNIPSIKVLKISELSAAEDIKKKWKIIKNIWITDNILWQRGVLSLSWRNDDDALIMLGNMYFISSWLAIVVARVRGKKVYLWTHGFRNNEKGLKGYVRSFYYALANGLFLYGNRAKDILIKKGFSSDKLHVIYNSLDFDTQTKIFNQIKVKDINDKKINLGIEDKVKIIIAIGRITKEKKLEMLIYAISELNKTAEKEYKLIIVGDGPELTTIKDTVQTLRVSGDVVFYGDCYQENEIALLLSMSNVSVVPGDIGLSAIHSLTYGTPVITHNDFTTHKPEFEAIKVGISGSFYNAGSVEDLTEKIRFWCYRDDDEVVQNCREVISKYYNSKYQKSVFDKVFNDNLQ